jgi:chaperonin GroEL
MKNKVTLQSEARDSLIRGVNVLTDAVASTLGPNGKAVVIQTAGYPLVTKDGVTVASCINLEDENENLGVSLIKQVSQQAAVKAGDGTTTATVLARAMIVDGEKLVNKGVNSNAIKTGMELALEEFKTILSDKYSKEISDPAEITSVATISANNDKVLGEVISGAIQGVGVTGSVNVENSATEKSYFKLIPGLTLEQRGWMNPHFVTNEAEQTVELKDPLIYISEKPINSEAEVMPILKLAKGQKPERSVVFIAPDINGHAFSTSLQNHTQGIVQSALVKAPFHGENQIKVLKDIAILTGTKINNSAAVTIEPAQWDVKDLGSCGQFNQSFTESVILDGFGEEEAILDQIDAITKELEHIKTQNTSKQQLDFLKERVSKLGSGVAQLYVGAGSESELKEKKDRVEDSLYATKAALEEGVSVGGGVTDLNIKTDLQPFIDSLEGDIKLGAEIFTNALSSPMKQILKNAINGEDEINTIIFKIQEHKSDSYGYNVYTKEFGDMNKMGVIDPTRVTRVALESAVSIAGLVLTTECLITYIMK